MKKTMKSILSFIVALVMVVSFVTIFGTTVLAANEVDTYATTGEGLADVTTDPSASTVLVDSAADLAASPWATMKNTPMVAFSAAGTEVPNWITVNANWTDPTTDLPGYDQAQAQMIQVRCTTTDGDASQAYLIGNDGITGYFELITTGNIGGLHTADGASKPPIKTNALKFFATATGTYTLTFTVYQCDPTNVSPNWAEDSSWESLPNVSTIGSGSIDVTVLAPVVTAPSNVTFNGASQTPLPTIKYGTTTLVKDTDYTLTYPADTTSVGSKTVTITYIGNYSGIAAATTSYSITSVPPSPTSAPIYYPPASTSAPGTTAVPTIEPTSWQPDAQIQSMLETKDMIQYVQGFPNDTFQPDAGITRAQVADIFFTLLKDANKNTSSTNLFPDVNSNSWYAGSVNYLTEIGILNGYENGTFAPDQSITRAEFVTIASRFDDIVNAGNNPFADVSSNNWAYNSIVSAYNKGWITGYPDGTFQPQGNITRAEAVTIVNRILGRRTLAASIPAQYDNLYPDVSTSNWAFADIVEASVAHDYTRDANGYETWK